MTTKSVILETTGSHRDQIDFAFILLGVPLLMLGDWNRSLILLVPFACTASLSHPLTKDSSLSLLMIIGGITTSLNTYAFSVSQPPRIFILMMIGLSIVASVFILAKIGKLLMAQRTYAPVELRL
ncbi:MAG: hypothetical protein HY231_05375 [Acidobacteria bacterium]|nr:hypothetical protein [Acidobacteriota bacterium]